ncbi:hypothetical protein IAT40_007249 [Kwoniella sp. CBS 6097]
MSWKRTGGASRSSSSTKSPGVPFSPRNKFHRAIIQKFKRERAERPLPHLPDEIWLDTFKTMQYIPYPNKDKKRNRDKRRNDALNAEIQVAVAAMPGAASVGQPAQVDNNVDAASKIEGDKACLVPLMRVSKRFHDLLSPLIYQHAVVRNPAQFFYGIDHSPNGRLSKIGKLRFVERLELDWPKSEAFAQPRVRHGSSHHMVNPGDLYSVSIQNAQAAIQSLKHYRVLYNDVMDQVILPNVDTLRFGHLNWWKYDQHHMIFSKSEANFKWGKNSASEPEAQAFMSRRHEIGDQFAFELSQAVRPRHVCQHTPLPPHTYHVGPSPRHTSTSNVGGEGTALPVTYTAPVGQWNRRYKVPIPLLIGSTTRLIIEPSCIQQFASEPFHSLSPHDHAVAIVLFVQWFRKALTQSLSNTLGSSKTGKNDSSAKEGTRIVVYIPYGIEDLGNSLRFLRDNQPDADDYTNQEILNSISQYLRGSNGWKNNCRGVKVEVASYPQAGNCPGCGRSWSLSQLV